MESILTSIKKMLGITEEYDHFDADLIMHINSVFMVLTQLGVGPSEGFRIEDELATWNDIIPADKNFEIIKSYMHLKVKLLFDPPLSSVVLGSMERMISEFEWRINVLAEQLVYDPPKPPSDPTPTPGEPDKPEEEDKKFEVEEVSIENHNVVLNYNGTAPNDIPSLEMGLSDGNMYVTNNGNYDLDFSISKNGMLQINGEVEEPEITPDEKEFAVSELSVEDHSVVLDYEGELPDDIPTLEMSLLDGNIYVTNNGNHDLDFSISKSGILQVNAEPEDTTEFDVDEVSIDGHDVVMDYTGEVPEDIPLLENSLTDGNMYVTNNGNYNVYFSVKNGLLQTNDDTENTETFDITNVYTVNGSAVVDYEGECVDPMPTLNTSFEEGSAYVENNGNNELVFSINNAKELEVNY